MSGWLVRKEPGAWRDGLHYPQRGHLGMLGHLGRVPSPGPRRGAVEYVARHLVLLFAAFPHAAQYANPMRSTGWERDAGGVFIERHNGAFAPTQRGPSDDPEVSRLGARARREGQ
jgi:hypothetical protein